MTGADLDWTRFFDVSHLVLESGILVVVLRFNVRWDRLVYRVDSLWMKYCNDHDIPYQPIGKNAGDA